jgi:hypothetical protein
MFHQNEWYKGCVGVDILKCNLEFDLFVCQWDVEKMENICMPWEAIGPKLSLTIVEKGGLYNQCEPKFIT